MSTVRPKEFRFPVDVAWSGGRRTVASVVGKAELAIATPPEFRGTDAYLWSPEDSFVAAAASCLVVTIAALAEKDELPLHNLDVHAEGVVGRRPDGRFGFIRVEQNVQLETDADRVDAAQALVARAEDGCLVSVSLDVPIQTTIDVGARPAAAARAA